MNINKVILSDYEDRDLSIYATSEFLEDFIYGNSIELDEDSDRMEIFDECSVGILSKSIFKDEETWILEKLIKDGGVQYFNETDVLFVESEIINVIDFEKINFHELVGFDKYEECEDNSRYEELDSLLEGMTNDLIDELKDSSKCPHCSVKEQLRIMYDVAEDITKDDILDKIDDIFR